MRNRIICESEQIVFSVSESRYFDFYFIKNKTEEALIIDFPETVAYIVNEDEELKEVSFTPSPMELEAGECVEINGSNVEDMDGIVDGEDVCNAVWQLLFEQNYKIRLV